MDPVTHALSGVVIYQFGFKKKVAFFAIVFSTLAPDLDYITRLWGLDVFLRYHRGITHGVLALFTFPALMGLIFRKHGGFFYYYFISFIAYGLHLFLDLTNQYGTRILSPLDWNSYSLDLTFIIDPYISIGLFISIVVARLNKKKATIIALCTVILLIIYIWGRWYLQVQALNFLKTKVDTNIYKVYPLPNDFLRWWFITKSGDEVNTGFVDIFTKRICFQDNYKINNDNPAIENSKKSQVVQNFLYFAKFPYAEVKIEDKMTLVIWRELSYSFFSGDRFIAKAVMNEKGEVIKAYFKF